MPALFCAGVSAVLFFAGLLNILPLAVILIYLGGFILLFKHIKEKTTLAKRDILFGCALLTCLAYLALRFRGQVLQHYDNFSHWGIVVKAMLQQNRLPNFSDSVIRFQSYPLGSSLFIYYFCRLVSDAESAMMFAQQMMQVSCLFALTALINNRNGFFATIAFAVYALYASIANIALYDLLVDTLLPVVAVATCAMIVHYKGQPEKAILCAGLMFTLLLNIKNSGIFFYAVCMIGLLIALRKHIKAFSSRILIYTGLIPLSMVYLWKRHVSYAFESGLTSKHSMSVSAYSDNYAKKGIEGVIEIAANYVDQLFSVDSRGFAYLGVIVLSLVFFAILIAAAFRRKTAYVGIVGFCAVAGVFLLYHAGMLGMYVFSMPAGEASSLAGFSRYHKTIEIFCFGLLYLMLVWLCETDSVSRFALVCCCAVIAVPLFQNRNDLNQLFAVERPVSSNLSSHERLINIKGKAGIQENSSYLLYQKGEYNSFYYYLLMYEFMSSNIKITNSIEEFEANASKYNYWIIWDNFEAVKASENLKNVVYTQIGESYVYAP